MDKQQDYTLNILKFFLNSIQSGDTNVTGYKGFYYHFLRMNSGTREWNCELSSVDTGLLMMGIIFARNYYNLDNNTENQIRLLASKLINRLDWDFFEMPFTGNMQIQFLLDGHLKKVCTIWAGLATTNHLFLIRFSCWKRNEKC